MSDLSRVTKQSVDAYGPLLDELSLSVKMELYRAIYGNAETMTEEVLSLGVALTADPDIRKYLKIILRKNDTQQT
jgi:hypothetical protein